MTATGQAMRDGYDKQPAGHRQTFPVLQSKGMDGQQRIEAVPDGRWAWDGNGKPPILDKAGHLLVTMGQNSESARLTAVASDERYVGQGWMPAPDMGAEEAKAAAVFLNSTPARLMISRRPGKTPAFPTFNPLAWQQVWLPDLSASPIRGPLLECWEATRHEIVPPYRDGYAAVRKLWDAAVCAAVGWDEAEIFALGEMLAAEPRVRGVAAGQWKP